MNSDPEQTLAAALREAGEQWRAERAPESLETAVIGSFRRRRQTSMLRRRAAPWIVGSAAALLAVFVLSVPFARHTPLQQPGRTAPPIAGPAAPAVVNRGEDSARKRNHTRRAEPELAYFIPLDNDDPMGMAQVMRVTLPASILTDFGLPAGEDFGSREIQADVLVGEDGLARAIRFKPEGF